MRNRNPSRAGKSHKEKENLYRLLKGISSSDTARIDSPFEPSNAINEDKSAKQSERNRPKPFKRKVWNHIKENSAIYITCLIPIMATLILKPFYNLNREVGEIKTNVTNMKETITEDTTAKKQQFSELYNRVSDLLNQITSIKTYLLNKFGAKF